MAESSESYVPVLSDVESIEGAAHPGGVEMMEWIFTNDKTNPVIGKMFHLLYSATFANKIGLMHARRKGTDEIETVIVGIEITPEGTMVRPIARILEESEMNNYEAPDGNGGYITQE